MQSRATNTLGFGIICACNCRVEWRRGKGSRHAERGCSLQKGKCLLKPYPFWFWQWAMPGGQFEWPLIRAMRCQKRQESLEKYCPWKVLQFAKLILTWRDSWGSKWHVCPIYPIEARVTGHQVTWWKLKSFILEDLDSEGSRTTPKGIILRTV